MFINGFWLSLSHRRLSNVSLFSSPYIYLAHGRSFTLVSTLHFCVRKSWKKASESQNSISKAKADSRKIYIENIKIKNLKDAERLVLIIVTLQKTKECNNINHWRDKNAVVSDAIFYLQQINTASDILYVAFTSCLVNVCCCFFLLIPFNKKDF